MSDETAIALRPVNPEMLIASAIEKGVDVSVMERLLVMRKELRAEAAKEAYDRALAQFQADCPPIQKTKKVMNKDGRSVRYAYAPLECIIAQVKELLQKHGFSYSVNAKTEAEGVTAICKATHSMGHSELSEFRVPIEKGAFMSAPQQVASSLTFAKRYSFCNCFGIMTADEDNDANLPEKEPKTAAQPNKTAPKPVSAQKQATPAKTADLLPKEATAKTRDWFLAEMGRSGVDEAEFLQFAIDSGVLLSTEVTSDWPLTKVPTSREGLAEVLKQFVAWQKAHLKPQSEAELSEPFWDIICPIPRKGQKRDEYTKNPDTIRSLYLAAKDGIQDAGKRLFGFANNWKPEPRVYQGKTYQPSAADHAFRKALDEFLDWREANGDQVGQQMREAVEDVDTTER